MMPTAIPVMPFLFLLLLLLPFQLSQLQMKGLAFFLWFLGGVILTSRGAWFLLSQPEHPALALLLLIAVAALAIGWAKGRFVLSKTSQRNIERIDAFTKPMRPIFVYSLRSWLMIGMMVGISLSLNLLPPGSTTVMVRGAVNLAIGAALIMSSLAYLKALVPTEKPSLPPESEHTIGPGLGP